MVVVVVVGGRGNGTLWGWSSGELGLSASTGNGRFGEGAHGFKAFKFFGGGGGLGNAGEVSGVLWGGFHWGAP